jgi:DNA polymerase-3 subunit delta
MIIKSHDIKNYFTKKSIFLFYGENDGLKDEIINNFFKKNHIDATFNYSEKDILNNLDNFYNQIKSKSFFDNKKLIIITDASDKIKEEIENLLELKLDDISIILVSKILEKKSKLRALFEKNNKLITIPFYKENYKTLGDLVKIFFKKKNILTSQETINIIIEKSSGDRKNLNNELEKIENFLGSNKKLSTVDVLKLTNLSENYSITELVNNCLAKNKKDTLKIINENNFSPEDCVIITRSMLYAAKRLLKLLEKKDKISNLEQLITSHKPPIFWKDKEIVKNQIKNWKLGNIQDLIFKINEIELLIKKNTNTALNIILNFLIEECLSVSN